jgi:hypothetical protein
MQHGIGQKHCGFGGCAAAQEVAVVVVRTADTGVDGLAPTTSELLGLLFLGSICLKIAEW